ncbi:MAG: hypothetical protein FWH57_03375 [Oscillospiraceae bacterium]|nr:hypothetical protein [Oscillospiraceae bacterium]
MKRFTSKSKALCLTIALAIILTAISGMIAQAIATQSVVVAQSTVGDQTVHEKIGFNDITGEGGNPPELTGTASALGIEQPWYAYLTYSETPVGATSIGVDKRIIYFDPYDYSNALVMAVQGNEGGQLATFTTANSIEFTYTQESTMHISYSTGTETATQTTYEALSELHESFAESSSKAVTDGWMAGKELSNTVGEETMRQDDFSWGLSEEVHVGSQLSLTEGIETEVGAKVGAEGSVGVDSTYAKVTAEASSSVRAKVEATETITAGLDVGSHQDWTQSDAVTTINSLTSVQMENRSGELTISDGVELTFGSSSSIAQGVARATAQTTAQTQEWSTGTSTTISYTYNATYFNSAGSPLPWRLVNYAVFMPLKYEYQYRINGNEWVTVYTDYCLLTTMQGTCRNWMNDNVSYIEHWGTGRPVVWSEFWKGFFTPSTLAETYQNKLYPTN